MGASLFELIIVLSLLAVSGSAALPALGHTRAVLAVRAARESVFALFNRARVLALQTGGAEIVLDASADRLHVRTPDGVIHYTVQLKDHNYDVDMVIAGVNDLLILRYDGHGLGRMMSRTITLRAHDARGGVTISSFGRVRRW